MRSRFELGRDGDVGLVIRQARENARLSLTALARAAGTSASHLSRVERGERRGVSAELLERVARALRIDQAELLVPAGLLPAGTQRELAGHRFARAFEGGTLPVDTGNALRRLHLAGMADESRRRAGAAGVPVDPKVILRAQRVQTFYEAGAAIPVRFPDGAHVVIDRARPQATVRFFEAHAAGHAALEEEPVCSLDSLSDAELDASTFAAFALAPRAEVRRALLAAADHHDLWAPEGSALITEIAERFGIPMWLAGRRIGEDGLLSEAAGVGEW